MKKLIYKFALLAALLVLMNWIYARFFFKDDLTKHSDEVELAWKVTEDSCVMVYTGESSNRTYSWSDNDRRKISDFIFEQFPGVKCGDMTKDASHAEVYYYLLENIPENAPVKTVIVTMNLRSFGYNWIESELETPIQKQLVLLKDYPPLFNRFKLAFKAYDIKTKEERRDAFVYHFKHDKIVFPYDFPYDNVTDWDKAMAQKGIKNDDGTRNQQLTELACNFIKVYGFQIHDNNPRVRDFDNIVKLAKERGWYLVFNLLAENTERAQELVGDDIVFLMRQNRDYLVKRYGNLENVIVVDNLEAIPDQYFIDRNWTTEHYFEPGRRIIANNVAEAIERTESFNYPESKIWKHGVYSKYDAAKYENVFDGMEVDIVYSTEKDDLFIGREESDADKNESFDAWLAMLENPAKPRLWIDFKNLSKENCTQAIASLNRLIDKYGIKNNVMVESQDVEALKYAKNSGFYVILWVDNLHYWREPHSHHDSVSICHTIRYKINKLHPDAISSEFTAYPMLCDSFPNENIHFWDTPKDFNEENIRHTQMLCREKSVKVVLVDYPQPIDY